MTATATATAIVLNIARMSREAGAVNWKPHYDMLADTFPAGRAILVNDNGNTFVATLAGETWGEVSERLWRKA